jgi:hypothetical protein
MKQESVVKHAQRGTIIQTNMNIYVTNLSSKPILQYQSIMEWRMEDISIQLLLAPSVE